MVNRSYLKDIQIRKTLRQASTLACILVFGGLSVLGGAQTATKMVQLPIPPLTVNFRSQLLGHKSPTDVLHINLALPPADAAGLQAFADGVSNPKSPTYRQFISPAQIGQRFGQPAATVQKMVSYLQSNGFTVKLVAASNMNIMADCTVAQAEKAFDTTINNYKVINTGIDKGRPNYYAFSEPPQMPAALAPYVLTIAGLENYSIAHPQHKKIAHSTKKFNGDPLTCTQTRTLYGVAPMWTAGFTGAGRNVGITNFDGFRLTNVPLYYTMFSLPTPAKGVGTNITVKTIDGGSGAGTPSGEGDIDIQMVLGMSPLCNFMIYDGGGGELDVTTAEQNDNICDIISESYGFILDSTDAQAEHNLRVMMTAQGQTTMNATGDSGTTLVPFTYPDFDSEPFHVGGTIADTDSPGNRLTEVAWPGGGGGWTTDALPFNSLPSWQKGNGVPTSINFRLNPDVALNAAGDTTGAYQFFLNGTLNFDYDGTSFACPVFAGGLSIAEQKIAASGAVGRLGRIQDSIYAQNGRSDVWFDVISGSNGVLPNGNVSQAGVGWDFCTGWGAINFNAFANVFSAVPPVVLVPTSAVPFLNPSLNANGVPKPPLTGFQEGSVYAGDFTDLAAIDGADYILSSAIEPQLGGVASAVVGFTSTINQSKLVNLTFTVQGTAPTLGTVMIYVQNQVTNNWDYMKSTSGSSISATNGVSVTVPFATVKNYMTPGGSASILIRCLVPNSRIQQIGGSFRFGLDEVAAAATVAS